MPLDWTKPAKVVEVQEWRNTSFDGGPPGGYIPNMSSEDARKWRARLVGHRTNAPQVEIRKSFSSAQLTVIVNLGTGYKYKHQTPETTRGINIHMATNGAIKMTFEEMEEFHECIGEAKAVLEALVNRIQTTKTAKKPEPSINIDDILEARQTNQPKF